MRRIHAYFCRSQFYEVLKAHLKACLREGRDTPVLGGFPPPGGLSLEADEQLQFQLGIVSTFCPCF